MCELIIPIKRNVFGIYDAVRSAALIPPIAGKKITQAEARPGVRDEIKLQSSEYAYSLLLCM